MTKTQRHKHYKKMWEELEMQSRRFYYMAPDSTICVFLNGLCDISRPVELECLPELMECEPKEHGDYWWDGDIWGEVFEGDLMRLVALDYAIEKSKP